MRVGYNPNKDKEQQPNDYFHQVIIPVYIPNEEGYFKDSFTILKYCLESLFKTSHDETYFTVVNNGSCKEVESYLSALYLNNNIQELIHTYNIGKLNAVLKGLTGEDFPLITVTDADVLFLNDWQNATYDVFKTFSKTGVVCPTPSSKSFSNKTSNLIFDNFFSKSLRFTSVKNPEALKAFAHSIGNSNFYNKTHLEKYLTLSKENIQTVVGAGHFVATYRSDIFSNIGILFSKYSLGGDSEGELLDKPVIKKGYWRLSTADNFAYHMGNIKEDWMVKTLDLIVQNNNKTKKFNLSTNKENKWMFWLKNILFSKVIFQNKIKEIFLEFKGLTREEAKNY